ncbi:hypothetical protein H0H93_006365 [Arthromyces matolae]|nr:hypothetical protein H0H93_006365 [Arthromyces matolae]
MNDWSKPCLSGICSYDIPESATTSSGSLKVWGSAGAISDITTAAGWEIIGCSPDELAQDIRLVCNTDSEGSGCSHLYDASGPQGKIVRLPESCGKNAFARVARAWIPEDQSIPASTAANLHRRDGSQPQVKALSLDTNFGAIDPAKYARYPTLTLSSHECDSAGQVNFAIQGANVKGAAADIDTSTVNLRRRSRIYGNRNIGRGFTDFVGNAIDSIKNLDTFNVNKSETLAPFSVDQPFNLFNQQVSCPPITASLSIDVDAKANAIATIGVAASGTIVPPEVKDFAVITTLQLAVTPSVEVTGTVQAHLIPSLNLKLSAFDDVVDAGIFLNLDTSAEMILSLEGTTQASVTVDQAAKREVRPGRYMRRQTLVAAEAPPRNFASSNKPSSKAHKKTKKTKSTQTGIPGTINASTIEDTTANLASTSAKTNALDVSSDSNASFGGCFRINAGLDVNAGADGDFFGLFDQNTKVSLFSKQFEILKKCFGNQKRSLDDLPSLMTSSFKKRAGLTCPTSGSSSPVSVADQLVQAGTITPVA